MPTQPPTNTIQVTSTAPLSALATDFNKWAEGRSGFTIDELVDIYANLVQLSPQRTQALKDQIHPKKITLDQYFNAHPELTKEEKTQIKINIVQFIAEHPEIIVTWEAPKIITEEPAKPGEKTPATPAEKPAAPKPAAPAAPQKPAPAAPVKPAVPPATIITRTKFPKWWNDEGTAKISLTSPGSQFIVTAKANFQLYISTIVLTVSGECTLVFSFGQYGSSGTMRFGGTDEPRGIVIAMGNSPAPCGTGSFMITAASGSAVSIGGFVSYFLWKKEQT